MTNCSSVGIGYVDERSWHRHGLCYNTTTPELWETSHYPSRAGRPSKDPNKGAGAVRERMKQACRGCPVFQRCAESALYFRDQGVVKAGVGLADYDFKNDLPQEITGMSLYDELEYIVKTGEELP